VVAVPREDGRAACVSRWKLGHRRRFRHGAPRARRQPENQVVAAGRLLRITVSVETTSTGRLIRLSAV
jgi:hypothetical protein